jgi:choline dehydrogenase
MMSGIGNQIELQRLGIPPVQHLPGVGQNFQNHFGIGCIWEYQQPLPVHNNGGEATYFWKSASNLDARDLQTCQAEVPFSSAETAAKFKPPAEFWSMFGGVMRPKSVGQIRLTGPNPSIPFAVRTIAYRILMT